MKFEGLSAMIVMTMIVCDMTPCSLVERYHRFRGMYWLYLKSRRSTSLLYSFLRDIPLRVSDRNA
jgi:hypothetical protein